jgi:two-component system, NtrC family, response regulator AtoC
MRILVVEDERPYRELLERQLTKRGYTVEAVGTAEDALALEAPDVLLCDISLPGMSGLEFLRRLKERSPSTEAIVLTGQGSIATAIEAMGLGAYHYFEKPVKFAELELYVHGACEKGRLARENQNLKVQLARRTRAPSFVGGSPAIKKVREFVARVSSTDAPVLVEGETGTGKDLVARAIHEASPRKTGSYVAINCGALSETLLENELFGHVAGAFTGATQEQRGLFEVADGGTLFIDEVAEMSLDIQKKFLRVLENGEFRRLGEARLRTADVRIVAATNRVLKSEVSQGNFREDLFYRLNVLSICTPPLREHLEDLPTLVDELLSQARAHTGRQFTADPEVLEVFSAYRWPGNVRELKNVLERAMVLAPGNTIRALDCPGLEDEDEDDGRDETPLRDKGAAPDVPVDGDSDLLEVVERRHIQKVLAATDGNKTLAAKRLGLSLRSLYRRLDKLGIKTDS